MSALGLRAGEILAMDPPIAIDAAIESMIKDHRYMNHGQLVLPIRWGMHAAISPQIDYCIYRSGAVRVISPAGVEPVIRGQDLIGFRLISQHSPT